MRDYHDALRIQRIMNTGQRARVKERIPNFVAATVEYHDVINTFFFQIWMNNDMRLDYSVDSEDSDLDDLDKLWQKMGDRIRYDTNG